ncbi:hypothetical protein CERZMDRAFT_86900 [Cercospora zeae-maydis SCOH1-5]|uniref:Rhodopsin domain-containing protein n=1 Tax=Cercospora zeae-maydis SCOH1-5 TaxID=717836 RepID=A0A6A6F8K2_9PEZI|nr:hypothetical protein CERZMDRAFT_86900 [Cercospora zeae-maydis SCOH1-5]
MRALVVGRLAMYPILAAVLESRAASPVQDTQTFAEQGLQTFDFTLGQVIHPTKTSGCKDGLARVTSLHIVSGNTAIRTTRDRRLCAECCCCSKAMPGNIINLSLADIAKWPKGNYINPHRRQWMPSYATFLYTLATLSILIRAVSRIQRSRHNGTRSTALLDVDDIILVIGWANLTWFTILNILGSEKYMTSRHMWDVVPSMYSPMAKITWLAEFAFLVCGACVKVSVLLFYRRLGQGTYPKMWSWACIGAIVFTLAWTLAFLLALIFNCSPTEAYWMGFSIEYDRKYTCVNTTVNNLLAGIMAVISDLYAVALPCFLMRKIRLPQAQKTGLYAVFSAGLLVVLAGSVRTYYLYQVGHSSDVSSVVFDVFAWSQAELCMGFLCASAPSLRLLGRQYFHGPYLRLKQHISPLLNRLSSTKRGGRSGGAGSGGLELTIRKLDCPYEQVRNDFSHVAKQRKKQLIESNFTDVTTLVQQEESEDDGDDSDELGIKKPAKAKIRGDSLVLPPPVTILQRDGGLEQMERDIGTRPRHHQEQPQPQQQQEEEEEEEDDDDDEEHGRNFLRHLTHSSADTDGSASMTRTNATHESKETNLQDNTIVDGYNRSWLDEGFEGDGVRMLKSYL